MRKLLTLLLMTFCMLSAHARSTEALIEPARVALPSAEGHALDTVGVRAAIVNAAKGRRWIVTAEQAGQLTLSFTKEGKHEVVVSVSYDDAGYQIKYVSSVGMKYHQGAAGAEIHPYYNKWVNNLSSDILKAVQDARH